MALWFHDAVYDPRAPDNEERSATWAWTAVTDGGVDAASAERIRALILSTRHARLPAGPDEALLVDIDLAILGAGEARFAEYERQIRDEYAFVPEATFVTKRRSVLASFRDRDATYATARYRDAYEARARRNLARALDETLGEPDRADDTGPGTDDGAPRGSRVDIGQRGDGR